MEWSVEDVFKWGLGALRSTLCQALTTMAMEWALSFVSYLNFWVAKDR